MTTGQNHHHRLFTILFLAMLWLAPAAYGQEHAMLFEKVLADASASGKHVLLVFSGSDWCVPCIRFEKEVLHSEYFAGYASENLVVFVADFPQHGKLPPEITAQNDSLAERFNPNGAFPKILLLTSSGQKIIASIAYTHQAPEEFVSQLKEILHSESREEYGRDLILMGSAFSIRIITKAGEDKAGELITMAVDEIKRIEHLISAWDSTSETAMINRMAGVEPVEVSPELYNLIERCIALSQLTQGAFDITFNGVYGLYDFDRKAHQLPDSAVVAEKINKVGYRKIKLLDNHRVFLTETGMAIGFGAIGKGYAADRAKAVLMTNGVESGIINASGDLTVWGEGLRFKERSVGIADPVNRGEILFRIPIEEKAVATSGDYEKYFMSKGVRFAHIIDPKTGFPVVHTKSVTIISNSAELSDALATAVFVTGYEVGIDLIDQLEGIEAIVIDSDNKLHFSKGLEYYDAKD